MPDLRYTNLKVKCMFVIFLIATFFEIKGNTCFDKFVKYNQCIDILQYTAIYFYRLQFHIIIVSL